MRKPFLRTPVDFARVSSKFNLKRLHPVLNTIRAHKGVDYAAATGTPIKSAGDGKVIFRGTKGGYGRTVIIQHGSQYSTLYAHMHKYANRTQKGARVKQGQIIGYVGKSGLATGPHLHYEFRVNGVHRNPLTVKLPDAQPLPETELIRFHSKTQTQFALLDTFKATMIASNEKERD
jgi:murein DD-endopeptidase MepM/ murein hydrolase activator NlpD